PHQRGVDRAVPFLAPVDVSQVERERGLIEDEGPADAEAHGERITSESIDVVEMDTADAPRAPAAPACDARVGAGQNERDEKRGKQQRRRLTHHRYQLIPGTTP